MRKLSEHLKNNWILLLILALGACLRLIALDQYPQGTYTDEAYGAYISYGLLTGGIDDRGCHFPVYFIAWGSGMSVLYSYLGVLFFKLFGVSLLSFRLPQAIFGILTIGAIYITAKELLGRQAGLLSALALCVNPWHIMMCRFGLDANLAPGMFMIGFMFLVLGLNKKHIFLVPSAVFFGLTLYCYALTWLILPIFLIFSLLFCLKPFLSSGRTLWLSALLLFGLALPLLVFLAVNYDFIPEIRTSFLTIPKLTGFRGGELSLNHLKEGIKSFLKIVILEQGDGSELLSNTFTGCYYFFTTPFMIFGILYHILSLFRQIKSGKTDLSFLFLAWLISAGMISVANTSLTMIHINMVHIPIIFYGAYGIYILGRLLKNKLVPYCCTAFYAVSLIFFAASYTQLESSFFFDEKPYEAVQRAKELSHEDSLIIFFGETTYKYPNFLWREKCDINDYVRNAVYDGDPFFAKLWEYGCYRFIEDNITLAERDDRNVYILYTSRMGDFHELGFCVEQVNDSYAVAAMQIPSQ